jgi:ACT domain-containing protein
MSGQFSTLSPAARRDLLRVLTSDSRVRADVIRQLHERDKAALVDVLIELEADDSLRLDAIMYLKELVPPESRDW